MDFTILQEQVRQARKRRNDKQTSQLLLSLAEKHTEHFQYSNALDSINGVIPLAKKMKDKELLAESLYRRGNILHQLGQSAEAELELKKALSHFEVVKNKNREIETRTQLAVLYSFQGNYTAALQIFLDVQEHYSTAKDIPGQACILGRIGHLYTEQEDYQQGLALSTEALAMYRSVNDKKGIWDSLWGIGFIYLEQKDHEKALQVFKEMELISGELDSPYFKAGTLCGMGMVHALQGNFDEGVAFEVEALRIVREIHARRNEALILRFLGQIYTMMGNYREAIDVLLHSLEIVTERGLLRMQFLAHECLSQAYEKTGEMGAAYQHFKKFISIQNNVRGNIKQHELTQLRIQFEHTKAQYEKEILRLRAINAEQEIQQKKKELGNLCADMARQHETLEKIRQDVLQIVQLSEQRRSTATPAKGLLLKITSILKDQGGMAVFERQFDDVHQSFLKNLVQAYPTLTPTELKICSLLRINLTTKEVAHLLCISIATVDLHRSHIRKKMELSAEQNLTSFLASV